MSVESYDSRDVIEQVLEVQQTEKVSHREIAERILDDDVAQGITRAFMWNYVGHPDKRQRLAGEQPDITRTINQVELKYTRELFTGFSDAGDLVHVRAIPGLLTEPQGYVVMLGDIESGIHEPVVHTSSTIGGIDPYDTRLQLLDRQAMDNAPWGYCPGQYAPPRDQHVLRVDRTGYDEPQVTYRKGRDGEVIFHPIEALSESIDAVVERRARMARAAFSVVSDVAEHRN